MPHPHSLFLLADHHHHHDGSLEVDEHEHGGATPWRGEFALRGTVVQAATAEGAFGEQISLTPEVLGAADWTGATEPFVWPLHLPLTGIGEPPELPPPRSPTTLA